MWRNKDVGQVLDRNLAWNLNTQSSTMEAVTALYFCRKVIDLNRGMNLICGQQQALFTISNWHPPHILENQMAMRHARILGDLKLGLYVDYGILEPLFSILVLWQKFQSHRITLRTLVFQRAKLKYSRYPFWTSEFESVPKDTGHALNHGIRNCLDTNHLKISIFPDSKAAIRTLENPSVTDRWLWRR